ncbi:hypothetical protein IPL68_02905 [Candidatus Saccharibacteria bacterium]|nr:MAG: hypothetical protein IPL68_02905 [Candidatus Saccharibacteria bacterium]
MLTSQTEQQIRNKRIKYGITPVIKQIDTLAGEFDAETNYLYATYHGTQHDIVPLSKNSNCNWLWAIFDWFFG